MRYMKESNGWKEQQETRRRPLYSIGFVFTVLSMISLLVQGIMRMRLHRPQNKSSPYEHHVPSHPMMFGAVGGLVDSIRKLLR